MTERTATVSFGYQHESSLIRHVRDAAFPDPAQLRDFLAAPRTGTMDAVAVGKGMSLTQASTEAGFASPGHFSDSFHAMFGLTARTRLVVLDTR